MWNEIKERCQQIQEDVILVLCDYMERIAEETRKLLEAIPLTPCPLQLNLLSELEAESEGQDFTVKIYLTEFAPYEGISCVEIVLVYRNPNREEEFQFPILETHRFPETIRSFTYCCTLGEIPAILETCEQLIRMIQNAQKRRKESLLLYLSEYEPFIQELAKQARRNQ